MSVQPTPEVDIKPPLWIPKLIGESSPWWGHVPFAFWLVEAVQPRILVELGAGRGVAYAAFCEAVARAPLATQCFAVDGGRQDGPGPGGDEAHDALQRFNADHYAAFSKLIRSSLDAAREQFADQSIDLLHVGGDMDAAQARRLAEAWGPKLSARAVLLIDGTNARRGEAGIRTLFEELAGVHPSFEFLHADGLGIVAMGAEPPAAMRALCALAGADMAAVRRSFADVGAVWAGVSEVHAESLRRRARIDDLERTLSAREASQSVLEDERARLDARCRVLTGERDNLAAQGRSIAAERDDARVRLDGLLTEDSSLREEHARAVAKAERLQYHNNELWLVLETAERLIASISQRYTRAVRDNTLLQLRQKLALAFRKLPVRRGRYRMIVNSVFFDPQYYLESNKDLAPGTDPVVHYLQHGSRERRNPSRDLSERKYLELHPDVAAAGFSAVEHYEKFGRRDGSPLLLDLTTAGMAGIAGNHPGRLLAGGAPADEAGSAPSDAPPPRALSVQPLRALPPDAAGSGRPMVLYLTHVPPWPVRAGNEYGTQRMMAWLERRGFDVVLVYCPLPGEGPDEARLRELMDYCPNLIWISRENELRHAVARPDLAAALAQLDGAPGRVDGAIDPTGRWAETLRTFCPDALVKVAQALDSAVEPAMVIANYIWTSRSLRHLRPGVLKAIQTHDVFSSLGGKVLEFGISHGLAMAPQEEALMLEPADLVLAVQPEEAAELRRIVSGPTVLHVGIDMDVVSEARTPERPTVLLIGSGNAMNVKGLRDFLRFSWPLIREAVPAAELQVAGSLGRAVPLGTEGVRALGFIDDLTPVYAGARLVINPAVAGTGIKIKTLEAMAHLRPLVTWPSGVDGVAPELRALCDVVTDWHVFTAAVIRLLDDDTAAKRVIAAKDVVTRILSPDSVFHELARELDRRLGVPSPGGVAE
ncbi:glycosyltransferase [Ancylobacter amanitiformis]|uniref:Glycosyltransferase n=1 Tax=Ancylobacter amanitiformis TaxID=217069 RepID=A0ABU0LVH4_9HYPH|nr:glycosyltransferase [Ancylobacter amanitiformis]MDQ0512610.1 hypothetical protein [Ancylobacter amanitiformis]